MTKVTSKKSSLTDIVYQSKLEDAVLLYQKEVKNGNKNDIELAYKKITNLYDPLAFYHNWYDQYKYLYDSQEDFIADYLKVFATVLVGWKPRNQRKKSRYGGTGEFKNYFMGSLYHNFINLVKADQAAKRNLTTCCPICSEWVNPISTHLISNHSSLLWDYLDEMDIDLNSLNSCPFCPNFKIIKNVNNREKLTNLLKDHFLSKHTSLLFTKFNDLYPTISTISPKINSVHVDENEELDIYDITEDKDSLINKIFSLELTELQKKLINQILNGESTLVYKEGKYKCTKEEWDLEIENLREAISIYGYE